MDSTGQLYFWPTHQCVAELPLPLFAPERLMHRPKLLNSVIKCERRSHNQPLIIGMGG